jgi:hypothetical protein
MGLLVSILRRRFLVAYVVLADGRVRVLVDGSFCWSLQQVVGVRCGVCCSFCGGSKMISLCWNLFLCQHFPKSSSAATQSNRKCRVFA